MDNLFFLSSYYSFVLFFYNVLDSDVQQSDSILHRYVCVYICMYIYIFFFRFFSILNYYKIFGILSCVVQ